MNRIMFAALALAALTAAAPHRPSSAAAADGAGNRLLPFTAPAARGRADPFAQHCSPDRHWCARVLRGGAGQPWRLELRGGAAVARSFALQAPEDDATSFQIWPHLVLARDGTVLIGVERIRDQAFSDKEEARAYLSLIRAAPGGGPLRRVLEVPTWGYNSLYMCLHPGDARRRFGACWDKAEFTGSLSFDPATRAGRPHFLFAARARTFPAHGVLEREMDRDAPMRRADARWAIDPECSYRRRIAFDPSQDLYIADREMPRCPDYFGF